MQMKPLVFKISNHQGLNMSNILLLDTWYVICLFLEADLTFKRIQMMLNAKQIFMEHSNRYYWPASNIFLVWLSSLLTRVKTKVIFKIFHK